MDVGGVTFCSLWMIGRPVGEKLDAKWWMGGWVCVEVRQRC